MTSERSEGVFVSLAELQAMQDALLSAQNQPETAHDKIGLVAGTLGRLIANAGAMELSLENIPLDGALSAPLSASVELLPGPLRIDEAIEQGKQEGEARARFQFPIREQTRPLVEEFTAQLISRPLPRSKSKLTVMPSHEIDFEKWEKAISKCESISWTAPGQTTPDHVAKKYTYHIWYLEKDGVPEMTRFGYEEYQTGGTYRVPIEYEERRRRGIDWHPGDSANVTIPACDKVITTNFDVVDGEVVGIHEDFVDYKGTLSRKKAAYSEGSSLLLDGGPTYQQRSEGLKSRSGGHFFLQSVGNSFLHFDALAEKFTPGADHTDAEQLSLTTETVIGRAQRICKDVPRAPIPPQA